MSNSGHWSSTCSAQLLKCHSSEDMCTNSNESLGAVQNLKSMWIDKAQNITYEARHLPPPDPCIHWCYQNHGEAAACKPLMGDIKQQSIKRLFLWVSTANTWISTRTVPSPMPELAPVTTTQRLVISMVHSCFLHAEQKGRHWQMLLRLKGDTL